MAKQNNLTYEDLLKIVELIKSSDQFSEFHLKVGEIEIDLKRRRGAATNSPPTAAAAIAPPGQRSGHVGGGELVIESAPPQHQPAAGGETAPTWPADAVVVRSPMVGTFYRAPEPGAPPFVGVGQAVSAETTVCIIEVMKLMNSIPAGASGVVTQVLVEDGAAVEYGQPLIVLQP